MSSKCSSGQRGEESLGTHHGQPAGNREREREREMATLAAGRGSQQSVEIEPVAVLTLLTLLRNYTDWQHQLCHRTTSQHQHEDENCS